MSRLSTLLAILALSMPACGGTDVTEATQEPQELTDEDRELLRHHEEINGGPIPIRDPQEPINWGEPDWAHADPDPGIPDAEDGEEIGAVRQATQIVVAHGWSLASKVATDGSGFDPTVTRIPELGIGLKNVLKGRCGRFDGNVNLSFKPCAVPKTFPLSVNSKVRWSYNTTGFANCPADPIGRTRFLQAVRGAFSLMGNQTGWEFVETTGAANITVRCVQAGEALDIAQQDVMAMGFPSGDLTFGHQADFAGLDTCEASGGNQAQKHYLVSKFFHYRQGQVVFDWNKAWNFVLSCPLGAGAGVQVDMFKTIAAHEILHSLGFQHQLQNVTGLMFDRATCEMLQTPRTSLSTPLKEALRLQRLPDNTKPLTVHDADLSCTNPN